MEIVKPETLCVLVCIINFILYYFLAIDSSYSTAASLCSCNNYIFSHFLAQSLQAVKSKGRIEHSSFALQCWTKVVRNKRLAVRTCSDFDSKLSAEYP